ncbi:SDR family NAD(P)-dependent oxidoreductase [Dietzia cinnamea]|uniref:SDR family NAD(P)-dependent oxidoreductase n=1 Tax=Dietzia cinnamea TaxID=321318 RepID=UPI00223AF352|nr:SDR family NAD(P)-dependent oxidoreductase [Dietzia cinnamea]MCT2060667.1 SDR family NAD(P)-dependent oxidoreductase [Dietzia cinnamea]MCT2234908.1 SDR family NAD(P)-dependent oxidoreductase [Dietzia cinnamea]MCT2299389.1 SDR family NAD(P)-dependent oxidoreductase [Dietzia cinnamea]
MDHANIDLPDLTGQTWLVTGSTSGVGLETARSASRNGARVILAVRDTARGRQVASELPGDARVVETDLASLASVRRAAGELTGEGGRGGEEIDVLVNNAGAITPRRRETEDGFEMLLGVNALAPFLLTNLLLPVVRRRVVIVASNAHHAGTFDGDDPHFRRRRWTSAAAYAQSKLGDMLWGLELERRLRDGRAEAGRAGVDVQLTHPGWAATGISNATGNATLDKIVTGVCSLFAQPAAQAALTTMSAATRPLPPCSYTGPDAMRHLRGMPTLIGRSAEASDPAAAARFWEFAEAETAAASATR